MRVIKSFLSAALFGIATLGVTGCEYFRPAPAPLTSVKADTYDGLTISAPMGQTGWWRP
jgi:hypothetical protein